MPEDECSIAEDESGVADVVDDDHAVGEIIEARGPGRAIRRAIEARPSAESLGREATVQLRCARRFVASECPPDRVAVRPVGVAAARRARAVTRREGNRVVEEEDRRPPVRFVERMLPVRERGQTGDPELPAVMASELAGRVDQAAAVPGEQSAVGNGMEIAPGVDAVPAGRRGHAVLRRRRGR